MGSRSGGLMANAFLFPLQFIAHFRLISQNLISECRNYLYLDWQPTVPRTVPYCSFIIWSRIKCRLEILNEKSRPLCKRSHKIQVKPDLNPFSLTPNAISCLASGFQKYTCGCFPLLPCISFHYCSSCYSSSQFMQFFSIDHAATEVATPDSPILQLIAKDL